MLSRFKFIIILVVLLTMSACNFGSSDSQWYVSPDGDDDSNCTSIQNACRTIQQAIDNASPEGLIHVMAGNYQENLIIEEHNLEIRGEGSESTIIDGAGLGAVVAVNGSTLILGDITVTNSGEDEAGILGEESRVIVNNSLITENDDGIRVHNSTLTISNSSIFSNSIRGVFIDLSQGGIVNSSISGNGLGIVSDGDSELNVSNSNISSNLKSGIEIRSNSIAFISTSTINDNFNGGVRLIRVIIAAPDDDPDEEVNYSGRSKCPEATITNSAIYNNVAFPLNGQYSLGGGIYNDWCGSVTITNTTLSNNQARIGGGIYNIITGEITIINSTIAVNSATDQGGGIQNYGEVSILNSIIALNTGTNCSSPIPSLGFNIDSDGSCSFNNNGDLSNIDALIDRALRNNGGYSFTHKLFDGSPALNAIDGGNCPATDQRGIERPQGVGCDIGAFEAEDSTVLIQITPLEIGPLPTGTPYPNPTAESSPSVTADQDANCRTGPDPDFPAISFLLANESASIVGRNSNSSWWVIDNINGSGTCWIWDDAVTVSGDISDIPEVTSPQKPTPTPTATPIALSAPMPISPSGDIICVSSINQSFTWQSVSSNVSTYRLVVEKSTSSASGPFEIYVFGDTSGLSLSKDITCDSLAYYRWHVRAVDNEGTTSPWSNWTGFRAYP